MTPKRFEKIQQTVNKRQKNLILVLENIHDAHNVSAILRTADAAGIDLIYLVYNTNKFPRISKTSSASAKKWVHLKKFDNVNDCFKELKKKKFKIYASCILQEQSVNSLYNLDFTGRTAFVFGNEHTGVSEDVMKLADFYFMIPMFGMVQSLNVSVSAAITVYEALRQRLLAGMYDKSEYGTRELKRKLKEYLSLK